MTSTYEAAVSADAFRHTMGKIAAAVGVVTTMDTDQPVGTTVSAFCSLSLEPPMMLVSLSRTSKLLPVLEPGSAFGLNVLASHHEELALKFASKDVDRFAGVQWRLSNGAPELADKASWVALTAVSFVPAGDHVLVLGEVTDAASLPHAPLVYYDRKFGTHLSR